jgi:hypothetical protein
MRLLFLALSIVIAFGLGVWGISKVVPTTTPQWVGVVLSMTYLFLLVFLAAAQRTWESSRSCVGNQLHRNHRFLHQYRSLVASASSHVVALTVVKWHYHSISQTEILYDNVHSHQLSVCRLAYDVRP